MFQANHVMCAFFFFRVPFQHREDPVGERKAGYTNTRCSITQSGRQVNLKLRCIENV